jgi:hypothetical protein
MPGWEAAEAQADADWAAEAWAAAAAWAVEAVAWAVAASGAVRRRLSRRRRRRWRRNVQHQRGGAAESAGSAPALGAVVGGELLSAPAHATDRVACRRAQALGACAGRRRWRRRAGGRGASLAHDRTALAAARGARGGRRGAVRCRVGHVAARHSACLRREAAGVPTARTAHLSSLVMPLSVACARSASALWPLPALGLAHTQNRTDDAPTAGAAARG